MTSNEELFRFFNEIGIINQLATNAFESCLPKGLTVSQFSVLNWFVRVDKQATPGRLATAFMVTKGAMTNTLKRLEDKGLIEVRPDETSGRRKLVTMTTLGLEVRQEALQTLEPLLKELAADLPKSKFVEAMPFLELVRVYLDERRYK